LSSITNSQLGVPDFVERVRARGFVLQILPIRDGGVPDAAFEREWQVVGPGVLDTLRSGGRILLHCRAGLGRTGTIAARILVELGTLPEAAIAAVRATRKGTIEAGEQESYVRRLQPKNEIVAASDRPYSAARPPALLDEATIDRARGALLGLAMGDALGRTLEFSPRDSKAAITGMVGGGPFHLAPGEWTDDTSMAICLAESLIAHSGLDERDL
jgi:ADP-ribosyl-[dinitrogen reductase] hydrolase